MGHELAVWRSPCGIEPVDRSGWQPPTSPDGDHDGRRGTVTTFGRMRHSDGRVTAMTSRALSPSDVAELVDPGAPWILLSEFGPGVHG